MATQMNCPEGNINFIYFRMSVGCSITRFSTWFPLIDKCKIKLSLWKATSFSMEGHLTLVRSVLGNLGMYLFYS